MKHNEYKKEVGSLTLSNEFKEALKQKCLNELEAPKEADKTPIIKIYKYISVAACFVAVVSAVGIISLVSGGLKPALLRDSIFKSAPESADMASEINESYNYGADIDVDESVEDIIVDEEEIEEPYIEFPELDDEDAWYDEAPSDDYALEGEITNDSIDTKEEDSVSYNGNHDANDYVLVLNRTPEATATNLYADFSKMQDALGYENKAFRKENNQAKNFSSILSNELKSANKDNSVSLVQFTVNKAYSKEEAEALGVERADIYTLYNVSVFYDYLKYQYVDLEMNLLIRGTSENQVEGMPIYTKGSQVIACLVANSEETNGFVTVIDELLYDIYTLSETRIAYHRFYKGINPGYTDMGIAEIERSVVTTVANNPAKYVHKATTYELTTAMIQDIFAEGYKPADLEKMSLLSLGKEIPTEPENAESTEEASEETPAKIYEKISIKVSEAKFKIMLGEDEIFLNDTASTALFEANKGLFEWELVTSVETNGLKLGFNDSSIWESTVNEISASVGCPLDISLCGIKLGFTGKEAMTALGLTQTLADNSTATLKCGDITATLTFENGKLTKMVIK